LNLTPFFTLQRRLRGLYYQAKLRREGLEPLYNRAFYLQQYPDVAAAGIEPEEHFYRFGRHEGRIANIPSLKFVGEPNANRQNVLW